MTEWDPDLSPTMLFLGALAATVALPLLVFRLPPGLRRVALGASLVAGSGFAIWMAIQPVNAGLEWPLLFVAGLAIGDAALLLFVPRVASLVAITLAILAAVAGGLGTRLIARSFIPVGSGSLAAFSSWILFAGVYSQIVLGFGVFVSSEAHQGHGEAEAPAPIV